uniref:Carboxypeptidase regulatory-like domain-containing protein n=1 Tax=Strongyloides venezuelensis TaxID=75913 RepID=A0A0K0FDS8_STRVS
MSRTVVGGQNVQQKIKKVLVLEWRQEQEISENEARQLIHNFSGQKKICHKHRNMVTSSRRIGDSGRSKKSITATPVSGRKRKCGRKVKNRSQSSKNVSKLSTSKMTRSGKTKSKSSQKGPPSKDVNIKKTKTDIKIDSKDNIITKQKMKIPYKLFWRPTISENGKEGITFKIQVQDLEGRKMELDVSCPGFKPTKVRLNGINLKKI